MPLSLLCHLLDKEDDDDGEDGDGVPVRPDTDLHISP